MRERMDLGPRCPQCGGPVVNSTHYLGRTEHPLVRECENGHAWDALDNVTMLDANGAALVTKDQTPPSIVPTDDERLTYRGRGIDGSRNSPGGYMGCGTLEEHCLQVRDPNSWVQSALPRWREQALLPMAHPIGVGVGMSGDFTVSVAMPLPIPTCPECGAVARNVTPFVSNERVRYVYRCLNGHRYEQAATNVQGAVETQQELADLGLLYGNFGSPHKWGPLQIFDESGKERRFTAEPCGPLEMLVMSLARELHDTEHGDCDWFGHVGSTITSFCRRACEARGLDWKWVLQAIERERLDERTEPR